MVFGALLGLFEDGVGLKTAEKRSAGEKAVFQAHAESRSIPVTQIMLYAAAGAILVLSFIFD